MVLSITSLITGFLGPVWNLIEGLFNGLFELLVGSVDALQSFLTALQDLPLELSQFANVIDPAGVGILALVIVGFALFILRIILNIF